MNRSDFLKVLGGVAIAVLLLFGGGFLAAQFLISQFTTPPPRPVFPNDNPSPAAKPTAAATASPTASPPSAAAVPTPKPEASVTPKPTASPTAGYRARIILSEGLNVRQGPNVDASRIGGVDYDEEVIVLEESPDKEWIRIRVQSSGIEGWIKSGYTDRVNSPSPQ